MITQNSPSVANLEFYPTFFDKCIDLKSAGLTVCYVIFSLIFLHHQMESLKSSGSDTKKVLLPVTFHMLKQ